LKARKTYLLQFIY